MTTEMVKLRQMLDEEGIEWIDCSDDKFFHIDRTHFWNRKFHWSVVHGYGTYGDILCLTPKTKGYLN